MVLKGKYLFIVYLILFQYLKVFYISTFVSQRLVLRRNFFFNFLVKIFIQMLICLMHFQGKIINFFLKNEALRSESFKLLYYLYSKLVEFFLRFSASKNN